MTAIRSGRSPLDRPPPRPPGRRSTLWRYFLATARAVQVRLRFFLVLLLAFVVVGKWDTLRNYWDRLMRGSGIFDTSHPVSLDIEYFCSMDPNVVSDWPGKCPVCNMPLAPRKKGTATPLPDGVFPRMQLSPYRLQLADVHTAPVGYQPLVRDLSLVGFVADQAHRPPHADASKAYVLAEVFDADLPYLVEGQAVEATSDAYPGRSPFAGKLVSIQAEEQSGLHFLRARLEIDDPRHELRDSMLLSTRVRVPVARFEPVAGKQAQEATADATSLALAAALFRPMGSCDGAGAGALFEAAFRAVCRQRQLGLAVAETAVVDTGATRLVYVESGPGMFDGVEVVLGPRCGDFYPVVRGLQAGQRVAMAGAFLIDAETRLNPHAAASYFGASASAGNAAPTAPSTSNRPAAGAAASGTDGLALLEPADQVLATKQKVCPVTKKPLGSMGKPVKVAIQGRTVFLCCEGCEDRLQANPEKYLSQLGDHPGNSH
jgi:Cu(I)/Ag(I) efflux system membrane fusion protein